MGVGHGSLCPSWPFSLPFLCYGLCFLRRDPARYALTAAPLHSSSEEHPQSIMEPSPKASNQETLPTVLLP